MVVCGQEPEEPHQTTRLGCLQWTQQYQATIDYLSVNAGLNTSNNFVIFSGGSAGGVGALQLRIRGESVTVVTVVGAPVGGFPPALSWYTGKTPMYQRKTFETQIFRI